MPALMSLLGFKSFWHSDMFDWKLRMRESSTEVDPDFWILLPLAGSPSR